LRWWNAAKEAARRAVDAVVGVRASLAPASYTQAYQGERIINSTAITIMDKTVLAAYSSSEEELN
jgi:hypothetical protein